MLLFSTMLDINDSLTKDNFIELVIKWNQGSPHADNIIKDIKWKGERNIRFEDGRLSLSIEEYRNGNTIAVRYEKKDEDGVIWDTDYVMNFTTRKMGIRLDRSYLENAVSPNSGFSTPHFISLLIAENYLKKDDDLSITNRPITLKMRISRKLQTLLMEKDIVCQLCLCLKHIMMSFRWM